MNFIYFKNKGGNFIITILTRSKVSKGKVEGKKKGKNEKGLFVFLGFY